MKQLGAEPATGQLQPGIWMNNCVDDGAATLEGWTQKSLRAFLSYAGDQGVRVITIWAVSGLTPQKSSSATCPWFVPELRRFVLGQKTDDHSRAQPPAAATKSRLRRGSLRLNVTECGPANLLPPFKAISKVGLGRIVALHHRSSASYQTYYHIWYLYC
jgi:hypothetical protein